MADILNTEVCSSIQMPSLIDRSLSLGSTSIDPSSKTIVGTLSYPLLRVFT